MDNLSTQIEDDVVRHSIGKHTLLYILTAMLVKPAFSQAPISWKPAEAPVYAVIPNMSVTSQDALSTKIGDLLMVQIYPNVAEPTIINERIDGATLYKVGDLVTLYVDGQQRGDVRIEAIKEHHCNSAAAIVWPLLPGVSARVSGVATNIGGIPSRPAARRNATAAERALAIRMANREFRQSGVSASLAGHIVETNLVAIDVGGLNPTTFVGSFYVESKTERHDLFIVARLPGTELSVEYARYGQTIDLDDFKDHADLHLVDHLDLDGDGVDEIILCIRGYESESYEIYDRQNTMWTMVWRSNVAGC